MIDRNKVTPYGTDSGTKKGQITTMFDRISPYYDKLNRILTLGIDVLWRKSAVKSLHGAKSDLILDIATGTADLAIEMAEKLKPKSIIGLDISRKMLNVGEEKIKKVNLESIIELEVGDSENLRFEDNHFDIVTASFGVRNFENLELGLAEMYRVTKKGGRIMILEFSKPRVFFLKQCFQIYFKYILPVIGKIQSKDPKAYRYLYESVQVFPDYEQFTEILIKIGYNETHFKPLSGGICTIYTATK
jgi:demethylmenaquinone methyltransferase/2-methoxy-6-polyprenyl-1,4-benzoquinol methylase